MNVPEYSAICKPLIFTGLKNSGKSIAAQLFAKQNNLPFADTDSLIAEITSKIPRVLFNECGAAIFAEAEESACRLALERRVRVIASGGALCENTNALELLKQKGSLVYLEISQEVFMRRLFETAAQEGEYPSFITRHQPKNRREIEILLIKLYAARSKKYQIVADITIAADKKKPSEICDILKAENIF